MKKFKLFLIVLTTILLLPFSVFAEETETTSKEDTNKVNVYFFRGDGCSHCAEAEEFFDSIQEEYGKYFNLVDYETWYNEENSKLMEKVAGELGDEVSGVPYIIIGEKTWNGYTSEYGDEIKETIKKEYKKAKSDRYDVIKVLNGSQKGKKENYSNDIIALIIIIVVVAGIVAGIIYTRKKV